jgi:hypothetical protein
MDLVSAYECSDIRLQESKELQDTPCDSVNVHNVILEKYAVSNTSRRWQVVDCAVLYIECESAASAIRPEYMNGAWVRSMDACWFASLGGRGNAVSRVDEVSDMHIWQAHSVKCRIKFHKIGRNRIQLGRRWSHFVAPEWIAKILSSQLVE